MAKDHDRFNKFCEKYDMYADGVEEDVVAFLKDKYPDAWKKALKEAKQNTYSTTPLFLLVSVCFLTTCLISIFILAV